MNHNRRNSQKNRRTKKLIAATIIAIIILSNTPPAQFFLLPRYSYQNRDRTFTYTEEPGQALDFKVAEIRWNRFKTEYKNQSQNLSSHNNNLTLYRTFRIRPWEFWQWWQFIAHPKRFTPPYTEN